MPTLIYERLNDTCIERAKSLIWGWFFAMADERRMEETYRWWGSMERIHI